MKCKTNKKKIAAIGGKRENSDVPRQVYGKVERFGRGTGSGEGVREIIQNSYQNSSAEKGSGTKSRGKKKNL